MNYFEIFKKFNEIKLDYIIVGGVALNLHGVPRMTYDIDIMIKLTKQNMRKIINQLKKWGYRLKIPLKESTLFDFKKLKSFIKEKNLKALSFYHEDMPIAEIDIVLYSPLPYQRLKKNAVFFDIYEEKIPVINIHDLIYIKSKSKRKQDKADVESLKKILEIK